jgi:Fe(3+) dicitrate transport protein
MIPLKKILLLFILVGIQCTIHAQVGEISGTVRDERAVLPGASVGLKNTAFEATTDGNGEFVLRNIPYGNYTLVIFAFNKETIEHDVQVGLVRLELDFVVRELSSELQEVEIRDEKDTTWGMSRMHAVDNFGVYEGKKTEVIVLQDMVVNAATNNPRQIYGKVTGLNIWESDGVGLQLGIGGRGLSPNRTANFNVRQNGYDISADALGYPESYYTPPVEALDQIEIIRGAASLQYGTQFGGLLNFKFKRGSYSKKVEVVSRQSIGSWGFFGSFNSIGGTVAKGKLNYYGYFNYKTGEGYRENAGFDFRNGYFALQYQVTPALNVNIDFTKMNYLAQQAGGLTDKLFESDPRRSIRDRNWFSVDWNLLAVNVTYKFSPHTEINLRNFGLLAQRQSLGNLERINVSDFGGNRTLINGKFENIGHETRLLHRYTIFGNDKPYVLLAGVRLYQGLSYAQQGDGNAASGPEFSFVNPGNLENSDYKFPNRNHAFFLENIIDINDKLSFVPGIRWENVQTFSEGYYKQRVFDAAGNIVVEEISEENLSRKRNFIIMGLGVSYKHSDKFELYSNLSQNYRAINFTDLRIVNPSFKVAPDIHDEKGYTFDIGTRGKLKRRYMYEVTFFCITYKDKIGQIHGVEDSGIEYRLRGNISDARNVGIEAFGEFDIAEVIRLKSVRWSLFVNTSYINARYINSDDTHIRRGNKVEMVPPFMIRTGTTVRYKHFSSTLQYAYTAGHFSDASNAKHTAAAVEGYIPAYHVVDFSTSYEWKFFTLEASCNNLLDTKYFTRRAESYPGPGIIPSDGRGFYLTLQVKLGN